MSVLDRSALSESPLADLHEIGSELSIDGYRRLRRDDLIQAILNKQGVVEEPAPEAELAEAAVVQDPDGADVVDAGADDEPEPSGTRRRRGRRGGRGRAAERADGEAADDQPEGRAAESRAADRHEDRDDADRTPRSASRRRARTEAPAQAPADQAPADQAPAGQAVADEAAADKVATEATPADMTPRAGRRGRGARPTADDQPDASPTPDEPVVEGTVELLPNGSGFMRVAGSQPSDDDVYISAAQVKRCELVSGDRITGPQRPPRRSERFASLIRVATINGRPASEQADSLRFDDLPSALPTERIVVDSEDSTLQAIEWLTPFGRGSRVTIVGAARAGKSEALRRLAAALAGSEDLTISVALAGIRPEEISQWSRDTDLPGPPAAAVSFAASEEAIAAIVEPVIDQARRIAARGADAVVLIDSLDGVSRHAARRLLAGARNLVDGGSVTVIATASAPIGGETTVIALDASLAGIGRFPALDLVASGTLKPELLVGDAGAEAIARTRAEVLHGEDADDES